jgi:hypothetical protein
MYGAAADPTAVVYEPPTIDGEGNPQPASYALADGTPVVWVNASNQDSVSTASGWFALYAGDPADYVAVVTETA